MRAYIKRTEACLEILNEITLDPDNFNETPYNLFQNEESFYGYISDARNSFIFQDARLPEFELPLRYVMID